MARSLIESWIRDQQLAFQASALRTLLDTTGNRDVRTARAALIRSLEAGVSDLSATQPTTKHQLLSLPQEIIAVLSQSLAKALRELEEAGAAWSSTDATLLANGASLLASDHVSLDEFGRWAVRAVPRGNRAHGKWSRAYWQGFRRRLRETTLDHVEALTTLRAPGTIYERITAAERLNSLDPAADTAADSVWRSLLFSLFNQQLSWPLLGIRVGEVTFGTSLPIGLEVAARRQRDGDNLVRFSCHRNGEQLLRDQPFEREGMRIDSFQGGRLSWDQPFFQSFTVGLRAAKRLWQSQNGRAPELRKRAVVDAGLVADLSLADVIASVPQISNFHLEGRSAELYLTQALLARFLGAPTPSGVATGIVNVFNPAMPVGWVLDIPAKVRYAHQQGTFSRIVLPAEAHGRLDEELRDTLAQSRDTARVEINYCPTARSAADAMQRKGWRRATFVNYPEGRLSFYRALGRLHANAVAEGRAAELDVELDPEVAPAMAVPFEPHHFNRFRKQSDQWLMQGAAGVRWLSVHPADVRPNLVGQWLAWLDHCTRVGPQDETGPGLGVLCAQIFDDDDDVRVWARLFDQMDVQKDLWEEFQWASADRAREILARVLNNFDGDPTISLTPPPDLLVLIDCAGMTRKRPNRIFEDDFRGQMGDVCTRQLGDLLRVRDDARRHVLGETRVLLLQLADSEDVQPRFPAPQDQRTYVLNVAQQALISSLAVFRSGFTVHAAWVVVNWRSSQVAARSMNEIYHALEDLMRLGAVGKHRGEYFLRWGYVKQHPHLLDCVGDHVAAATALAPIIDPDGRFPATNRDSLFESWAIQEAVWHLQKAAKTLPARMVFSRTLVKQATLTLLTLMPFPDWDLVRPVMGSTDAGVRESCELVEELIAAEARARGNASKVHSSRYALAINGLARRAEDLAKNPGELASVQRKAEDWFAVAWSSISDFERSAEAVKLLSEYAYFLRMSRGSPTLLLDIENRLDNVLLAYWEGRRAERDVPLSQDWVRKRVGDESRDLRSRCKDARIASELWGQNWTDPWLWLMARMTPAEFDTAEFAKVLQLYVGDGRHPNVAMTDFAMTVRLRSWTKPARQLGQDVAANLASWLCKAKDPLHGPPADWAAAWIKEWTRESHNCFDFVESLDLNYLLNEGLVDRENRHSELVTALLSDSWGCWSFFDRFAASPASGDNATLRTTVLHLSRLRPTTNFEPGEVIVQAKSHERIGRGHLPHRPDRAKSHTLDWLNRTCHTFQSAGDDQAADACRHLSTRLERNV